MSGWWPTYAKRYLPIRKADPQQLRQRIALVPQDPIIFGADAWQNIRYGLADVSDAESERLVQEALEQLMQARTTLIIAHRPATVRKVDRIMVMDQGQLVASGRHEELVEENGLYARLAALQFRNIQATLGV